MTDTEAGALDRFREHARRWRVEVDGSLETFSSHIGFGRRGDRAVVLKVVKRPGDEWLAGRVIHAFDGCGVVRALEVADGAVLMERLAPAHSLATTVGEGEDDAAVEAVASVIARMTASKAIAPLTSPAVQDWAQGFAGYLAGDDASLSRGLVQRALHEFEALATSQRGVRLLHGDLHHDNVVFDAIRGWTAIDPKGVVGETEYELGAFLRNPTPKLDAFGSPAAIERRIRRFVDRLDVDVERTLRWAFAQAVLALVWSIEDGEPVRPAHPVLSLATTIETMLTRP